MQASGTASPVPTATEETPGMPDNCRSNFSTNIDLESGLSYFLAAGFPGGGSQMLPTSRCFELNPGSVCIKFHIVLTSSPVPFSSMTESATGQTTRTDRDRLPNLLPSGHAAKRHRATCQN